MLVYRRRRWPNINQTLGESRVLWLTWKTFNTVTHITTAVLAVDKLNTENPKNLTINLKSLKIVIPEIKKYQWVRIAFEMLCTKDGN